MVADKDFDNGRTARAVARRFAVFIPIVVVWLVLDQASKLFFNGSYHAGQVISDPILGIFRFHLVYNTGGAWSIFSGATWALGAFSLVVCIALTAYLAEIRRRIAALDEREPENMSSEAHDEWSEEHEQLEDLADDILDRIEE